MIEFSKLTNKTKFEIKILPKISSTLSSFFNIEIEYISNPIKIILDECGIDIRDNVKRGVYHAHDVTYLLGRIQRRNSTGGNEVVSAMAFKMNGLDFKRMSHFLNVMESTLSKMLSSGPIHKVSEHGDLFGDIFIESTIAKYLGNGAYNLINIRVLIDIFRKLSITSFEGRFFTTGLILTRAFHAYKSNVENETRIVKNLGTDIEKIITQRGGIILHLNKVSDIISSSNINKRFWYLMDGENSFFLAKEYKEIISIEHCFYLTHKEITQDNFIENFNLIKTIMGNDILFRVTGENEVSITTSSGMDFNYKENRWQLRMFDGYTTMMCKILDVKVEFVESLLGYLFQIAKERISSIIWLPKNEDAILQKVSMSREFFSPPINIYNQKQSPILKRILSSDGTTIISQNGDLISFSAMVNFEHAYSGEIRGSGELAAEFLSENGIAIKISQDGAINIFHNRIIVMRL